MGVTILLLFVAALNFIQDVSCEKSVWDITDNVQLQWTNLWDKLRIQRFADVEGTVCYQDIGCFSKNGTFKNLKGLPDSPKMIATSFDLYTRKYPKQPIYLHYLNSSSIHDPAFDPEKKLKIICHGFAMSGESNHVQNMKDALLEAMDCNVIVIDWRRGALPPFYMSAAFDTELVGRQVGRLVSLLMTNRNLKITDVHIIGFSLGAHLAGFAGKWLRTEYGYTVGRISALDPASFLFEGRGEDVHVSSKDALYVDVVHTSSGTNILSGELGMTEAVGHVDYYPNGGKKQPGCNGLICNHMRAMDLFTDSIDGSCEFRAVACDTWQFFDDGGCFQTKATQTGRMGYFSDPLSANGTLYLATTRSAPFCGTSILVTLSISKVQQKTYGDVAIALQTSTGVSEMINITDSNSQTMHPKEALRKLAVVNPAIFPQSEVHIHYMSYKGWFYSGTEDFFFDVLTVRDEAGHVWFEYRGQDTKVSSLEHRVLQI